MSKTPEAKQPAQPQGPVPEEAETIEVALGEASHAQLLWFCKQQGYEYSDMETPHQTLGRIKSAWEHPTITVPAVIEEEVQKPRPVIVEGADAEDRYGLPKKVRIKIHSLGEDSQTEQHLAHEGRAYRIAVGETVTLPWYVVAGCLMDAKQLRYRSDTELGLGEPMVTQGISFSILGPG